MVFWIVFEWCLISCFFKKTCSLRVSWIFSAVRNFPWRPFPGETWMGGIVGLATKITKIKVNRDGRKTCGTTLSGLYSIVLSYLILYYIILYYIIFSYSIHEANIAIFEVNGDSMFFFFRKRSDRRQAVGALSAPNTGVHPESEEGTTRRDPGWDFDSWRYVTRAARNMEISTIGSFLFHEIWFSRRFPPAFKGLISLNLEPLPQINKGLLLHYAARAWHFSDPLHGWATLKNVDVSVAFLSHRLPYARQPEQKKTRWIWLSSPWCPKVHMKTSRCFVDFKITTVFKVFEAYGMGVYLNVRIIFDPPPPFLMFICKRTFSGAPFFCFSENIFFGDLVSLYSIQFSTY